MSTFTGQELEFLNNYMKNRQKDEIAESVIANTALLDGLQGCINKEDFYGEYSEIVMELSQPRTGKAHYEDGDIPLAQRALYEKMLIPTKEMIANAGISMQAMNRARGGLTSWGNAAERALKLLDRDMKLLANYASLGDGTAKLARVKSISGTNSHGDYTLALTCDNTYADFGWDNTENIAVGMQVDIYDADFAEAKMLGGTVTINAPGRRSAGTGTAWAAVDGVVTIAGHVIAAVEDGDVIYIADSKPVTEAGYWNSHDRGLPMGLTGLVTDGLIYGPATFQGKARASYSTLRARIYAAASTHADGQLNIQDFGLASESPAFGVPTYWGMSDISNILTDIANGDGAGEVDAMFCSLEIAGALARKSAETNQVQVVVSDVGKDMKVTGGRIAKTFIGPDGREIPIYISKTLPKHTLHMITTDDIEWFQDQPFGYLKRYGEIWEPQPNSRKTNFEAPYYGSYQIGARRCDNMAVMMDMRYDI